MYNIVGSVTPPPPGLRGGGSTVHKEGGQLGGGGDDVDVPVSLETSDVGSKCKVGCWAKLPFCRKGL